MAHPARFELTTSAFGGQRSIYSYRRVLARGPSPLPYIRRRCHQLPWPASVFDDRTWTGELLEAVARVSGRPLTGTCLGSALRALSRRVWVEETPAVTSSVRRSACPVC